jgi:Flavodoxin
MKVVVLYESMYGDTHTVADCIAEGLRATGADVDVVHVSDCEPGAVRAADLIVVGGPTHVRAMPRPSTRKAAVDRANTRHQVSEPTARRDGLREWFDTMASAHGTPAAAFDTRQDAARVLTGQASLGIRNRLRARGFRMVAAPESFLVDKQPQLLAGETDRAKDWGRTIAELSLSRPAAMPRSGA